MFITKEFTVLVDDQPGLLGEVCLALAYSDVNILALQSAPVRGKFVTRLIVDNPAVAKMVLDSKQLCYAEAEIVQVKILHRPGEIARLASQLGRANVNIHYAYCGLEPGTNTPLVFFGVAEPSKAVSILEHRAAAVARP